MFNLKGLRFLLRYTPLINENPNGNYDEQTIKRVIIYLKIENLLARTIYFGLLLGASSQLLAQIFGMRECNFFPVFFSKKHNRPIIEPEEKRSELYYHKRNRNGSTIIVHN